MKINYCKNIMSMKIFTKLASAILLLSLSMGAVAQTTYYVSETGDDANDGLSEATAFATLNRAADKDASVNGDRQLANGDIIKVIGTVTCGSANGAIPNKLLTIEGVGDNATIDGEGANRFFGNLIVGNGYFTVKNIHFTNSVNANPLINIIAQYNQSGNVNVLFENCKFTNNKCNNKSLVYTYGYNVTFKNCDFKNNQGKQGGVIFIDGAKATGSVDNTNLYYSVDINIENCLFSENKATQNGGALQMSTGFTGNENSPINLKVINSTFYRNHITRPVGGGGGNGGAILIQGTLPDEFSKNQVASSFEFTYLTIVDNYTDAGYVIDETTTQSGNWAQCGGLNFASTVPGTLAIKNCLLYGNKVKTIDGTGTEYSDLAMGGKTATITNCFVGAAAGATFDATSNAGALDSSTGAIANFPAFSYYPLSDLGVVTFPNSEWPATHGNINLSSIKTDQLGKSRDHGDNMPMSVGAWEYDPTTTDLDEYNIETPKALVVPNPVVGTASVLLSEGEISNVNIFSLTGAKVTSFEGSGMVTLPTLNTGVYFVVVESSTGKQVQKIVVK